MDDKFQQDYDNERFQGVKVLADAAWGHVGSYVKAIFWIWLILYVLSLSC
jgi:hypothetical protein